MIGIGMPLNYNYNIQNCNKQNNMYVVRLNFEIL